jgi:hypothetical protein
MIKTIETNLLAPMRRTLNRWMQDPIVGKSMSTHACPESCIDPVNFQGHPLSISPLPLLWPALERIDNAIGESNL